MTAKSLKIAVSLLLAGFLALFGIRTYNIYRFHVEEETRFLMDTEVTIYAVGPERTTSKAVKKAFERLEGIYSKFNPNNPQSPIYLFNHEGEPISDEEILKVVRFSLGVSRETQGAFDITTFVLTELWGFNTKTPHVPSAEELAEVLKNVGYKHLEIRDGKLYKDTPQVVIHIGGLAKGYAIKEAVKVLKSEGVSSAVVVIGGDTYAMGKKGNKPWRIGIKDPQGDGILGYVEVEDMAVMGAGDYKRFFTVDGIKYHHIFDPRTGYPTQGVAGVTVVNTDPLVADAWDTTLMVMGREEGMKEAEKMPGLGVIMVTPSGEVLYSSSLKGALKSVPLNDKNKAK